MTGRPDLLLTFDFPPMVGGIARVMSQLALRYPAGQLVVSTGMLAGAAESDRVFPNRIDRLAYPSRRLKTLPGLLRWSRRVSGLFEGFRPRFIWCGNLRPAAYPAKWARDRRAVPYGVLLSGGDLLALRHNYQRSRLKRATARSLLGSAAVLVAISRWTRDLCADVLEELQLSAAAGRVRVVPLGTDPAAFRPGIDPAPARVRHGLGPGRWLLTVARLVPHKGIDTTIQALAQLRREFADLRYLVVGTGSQEAALRALARQLGVDDAVRFLGDVEDAELPALYNLAELYVGASRQTARDVEGFGIALLEAGACGKPVVAGASGGIPDAVRHGETGLLVNAEEPAAVGVALRQLLLDPPRARAMGEAGRRAVESSFNWDRVVHDLRMMSASAASAASAAPR